MARRPRSPETLDTELLALPPEERWRTWMGRVEAVIFAAPAPVGREVLARVVGRACNLALLLDDIRAELAGRPYELVAVAGGWQHRTKQGFAGAIQAAAGLGDAVRPLSPTESLVLMAIAYLQPITRAELGRLLGKEISRDLIGALRSRGFIGAGPRSPQPGSPYTYVTTKTFLSHFGFESLRELPDLERLEDAGLLSKQKVSGALPELLDASNEGERVDGDDEDST